MKFFISLLSLNFSFFSLLAQGDFQYGVNINDKTKIVDKIYPQPKADFTAATEVCWQTPITFTNASN